jgi:thiol peroxidase
MATITLKGNPIHTLGELPAVGSKLPEVRGTTTTLQDVSVSSYPGKKVLNIFPSVDTGVCAMSVRAFNEKASGIEGVTVVNISADLPFAMARFCGAEGLKGVVSLSGFRSDAAEVLGVTLVDGVLKGLCSRAVVVVGEDGTVLYTEQVPEIGQEPDYASALAALG